jgi:DNA-binding LytR/AlgR family response regulator
MSSILPTSPNVLLLEQSLRKSNRKKRISFDVEQVAYFVGYGNYTFIHFTDNKRLLVAYTLSVLIKQFDESMLFRAHKSNAVNINQIAQVCTNKCEIVMYDGAVLKLSRRKIQEIRQKIA